MGCVLYRALMIMDGKMIAIVNSRLPLSVRMEIDRR